MTTRAETADRALLLPAPRSGARPRLLAPDFPTAIATPAIVFGAVVFIVPIVIMVVRSLTDPGPENYATAFSSELFLSSLWTTVRMSLAVTGICLVLGYPFAYAMARSGPALRVVLFAAVLLTFWTSTLVRTYAWQILLNNTGLINRTLLDLGLITEPLPLIRNDFAVYVGMTHVLIPFVILTVYASVAAIRPELEQAALSLGANRVSVFFRVTLPLSMPGALAGAVLVFVLALGFYTTPEVLGDTRNLYVGSVIIQQIEVLLRTGVGAAQAVVLLAIVLAILFAAATVLGAGRLLGVDLAQKNKKRKEQR